MSRDYTRGSFRHSFDDFRESRISLNLLFTTATNERNLLRPKDFRYSFVHSPIPPSLSRNVSSLRRCVTERPVTGQGIDRVVFNAFVLGNFLTAIKFNCPSDPYLSGNSLVCLGQKDIMT